MPSADLISPFTHHPTGPWVLPVCSTSSAVGSSPACPSCSLPPQGKGVWLDLCLLRWNPVWYPVILPAVIYHSTLLSFPPSEECVHLCILNPDLGLKNMIRKCRHKEFVPEATLVGIVSALPTHCSRQKHTVGGSVYVSCLL